MNTALKLIAKRGWLFVSLLASMNIVLAAQTCDDFVYLNDGRFMLGAAPYQFKGANFGIQVGGVVQTRKNGKPFKWRYFLSPYPYFPDNNGVCIGPPGSSTPQAPCCSSAGSCLSRFDLLIQKLQALNANSVRLLSDIRFDANGKPYMLCARVWDQYVQQDGTDCRIDLTSSSGFTRAIQILQQAIDRLGANGIRSIVLVSGDSTVASIPNTLAYTSLLSKIAAKLKTDPYVIGYDPYNEPPYHSEIFNYAQNMCGGMPFCKMAAQAASHTWFDALTQSDPYHFVTVGLSSPSNSLIMNWDPHILYEHFTSYHTYPVSPWNEQIHGSRIFDVEIYRAGLGACGVKCPFLGEYDGANCLVGAGPLTTQGFIYQNGFYSSWASPSNHCPIGTDDTVHCEIAQFEPGRDAPFILNQPFFYVAQKNGQCPAGTSFDTANCQVAMGPPGVNGFIYAIAGIPRFYYSYISATEHCRAPATDDTKNCLVAPVPTGYAPFVVYRPLYYVASTQCGSKKPMYFGETGFAVFPNGTDLDTASYTAPLRRAEGFSWCWDDQNQVVKEPQVHGNELEQTRFVTGDASISWRGLHPFGRACGFQGLHWWLFGSVHGGNCQGNNYGLYGFWYDKQLSTADPDLLVARPVASTLASSLIDFRNAPDTKCTPTSDTFRDLSRGRGVANYRFHGRIVKDGNPLLPVGHAFVQGWNNSPIAAVPLSGVNTKYDGRFTVEIDKCLSAVGATDYGYSIDYRSIDASYCPLVTSAIQDVDLGDFHISHLPYELGDLNPPNVPRQACLKNGKWVMQ